MAIMAVTAKTREEGKYWTTRTLLLDRRHPVALRRHAQTVTERDESIDLLQQAFAAGFLTADGHYNLGMHCRLANRPEDAFEAMQRCLLVNSSHLGARASIIALYIYKEEYAHALRHIDLALATVESLPDKAEFGGANEPFHTSLVLLYHRRQQALAGLGRMDEAREAEQWVYRITPVGRDITTLMKSFSAELMYSAQPERRYWESSSFTPAQWHAARHAAERLGSESDEVAKDDFIRICLWGVDHLVPEYVEALGVDIRNSSGCTPLVAASMCGNLRAVVKLLELGADPNAAWLSDGNPHSYALHECLITKNYLVAKMLLKAGANPQAVDGQGRLPIEIITGEKAGGGDAAGALHNKIDSIMDNQLSVWHKAVIVMDKQIAEAQQELDELSAEHRQEMIRFAGAIAHASPGRGYKRSDAWMWHNVPYDKIPATMLHHYGSNRFYEPDPERPGPRVVLDDDLDLAREGPAASIVQSGQLKQLSLALTAYGLTELVYPETDERRLRAAQAVERVIARIEEPYSDLQNK